MTSFTTFARTAAFAAVLFATTAPAFAADADDGLPQGTLNIAGADFTSPKAVDHLKARVRRIAFEICVPNGDSRMPIPADQRACVDTAVKNGLAAIDSKQEQAMASKKIDVASAQTDKH